MSFCRNPHKKRSVVCSQHDSQITEMLKAKKDAKQASGMKNFIKSNIQNISTITTHSRGHSKFIHIAIFERCLEETSKPKAGPSIVQRSMSRVESKICTTSSNFKIDHVKISNYKKLARKQVGKAEEIRKLEKNPSTQDHPLPRAKKSLNYGSFIDVQRPSNPDNQMSKVETIQTKHNLRKQKNKENMSFVTSTATSQKTLRIKPGKHNLVCKEHNQ